MPCCGHATLPWRLRLLTPVLVGLLTGLPSHTAAGRCHGRYTLAADEPGNVTDGGGLYGAFQECEWLIRVENVTENASRVALSMLEYDTECSYDFLFVYDGPSSSSPLLAALSGNVLPDAIYSSGPEVLVSFYSDVNYVRGGFTIEYQAVGATECAPRDVGPQCAFGVDCMESRTCFGTTPYRLGAGLLSNASAIAPGVWGLAAEQDQRGTFTPRFGHTSTYLQELGGLAVFGGRNLVQPLDELLLFSLDTFVWSVLPDPTPGGTPTPSARFAHAAVYEEGALYILGGDTVAGMTDEVWSFVAAPTAGEIGGWAPKRALPESLSQHTATVVSSGLTYVIGGRTFLSEFSAQVYVANLSAQTWSALAPAAGPDAQVAGHVAEYFDAELSIYVFGGFRPFNPYYSERSSRVFRLSTESHQWTEIDSLQGVQPQQVSFAAAARLNENTMVVYGGNRHIHGRDETCYEPNLWAYSVECNSWSIVDGREHLSRGRFEHTLNAVDGVVYAIGGFAGVALGDALEYEPQPHLCGAQATSASCTATTMCGWCGPSTSVVDTAFTPRHGEIIDPSTQSVASWTVERVLNPSSAQTLRQQAVGVCAEVCLETVNCSGFEPRVNASQSTVTCRFVGVPVDCFDRVNIRLLPAPTNESDSIVYELTRTMQTACTNFGLVLARVCTQPSFAHLRCGANATCVGVDGSNLRCACDAGFVAVTNGTCIPCTSSGPDVCGNSTSATFQAGLPNVWSLPPLSPNMSSASRVSLENACFPSVDSAAQSYFAALSSENLLDVGVWSHTGLQSSTWMGHFADHAYAASTISTSPCSITLRETTPWWEVFLGDTQAIGTVRLSVPGCNTFNITDCPIHESELAVTLWNSAILSTQCFRVSSTATPSSDLYYDCNATGSRIRISRNVPGPRQRLALCNVAVSLNAAAGTPLDSGECGGGSGLLWTNGNCSSVCARLTTCSSCSTDPQCTWCPTTTSCHIQSANATCLDGFVSDWVACFDVIREMGIIRDTYSPEGLSETQRIDAALQRTSPAVVANDPLEHVTLPSFLSELANPSNVIEIIQGYIIPPTTANYTFWIRSEQGFEARLYLNPSGTSGDLADIRLVARQPQSITRVTSWQQFGEQRSLPVLLEAHESYYISSNTFVSQQGGRHVLQVAWSTDVTLAVPSVTSIIASGSLRLPDASNCSNIQNCQGCTAEANCLWCDGTCTERNSSIALSCDLAVDSSSGCAVCSEYIDCFNCRQDLGCQWRTDRCENYRATTSGAVSIPSGLECPPRCSTHTNCSSCYSGAGCSWCESTQSCFEFSGYLTQFVAGLCRNWAPYLNTCRNCSEHTTCASCTTDHGCGWCHNGDDPTQGRCSAGSQSGDVTGLCLANASVALNVTSVHTNVTYTLSEWSYQTCPDVDECALGYDNCTQNSTCTNEPGFPAFSCTCSPGFIAATNSTCVPHCPGCAHGVCTSPNRCECSLNWNGTNCTTCLASSACHSVYGNMSSCIQQHHTGTCTCDTGYARTGRTDGQCDPVCSDGCVNGHCVAPETCVCQRGWIGPNCTACNPSLCDPHSTLGCTVFGPSPFNLSLSCDCAQGYSPSNDSLVCDPVCSGSAPGRDACDGNGNCTAPSLCLCEDGYYGSHCEFCNNSEAQIVFGCHPNASCVNGLFAGAGGLPCQCNPGFSGDGFNCAPICESCVFGMCIAPDHCACNPGAAGPACDECDASNPCNDHAACGTTSRRAVSTINGTSQCSDMNLTARDSTGTLVSCSDYVVDIWCLLGRHGSLWTSAIEAHYSWTDDLAARVTQSCCSCGGGHRPLNFTQIRNLTGETLSFSSVATASGTLNVSNISSTYFCACLDGYSGDGLDCEPVCTANCSHGRCTAPENCACEPGWGGASCAVCQTDILACGTHAHCDSGTPGADDTCSCDQGYSGDPFHGCVPVCTAACVHGSCTAPDTCACAPQWSGTMCDECDPSVSPCSANSTCAWSVPRSSFVCQCDTGFLADSTGLCSPVCSSGCVNGECVAPEVCDCNPGFSNRALNNCTECESLQYTFPVNAQSAQGYLSPCGAHGQCITDTSLPSQCGCLSGFLWATSTPSDMRCHDRIICRDSPTGWVDALNRSCAEYALSGVCNSGTPVQDTEQWASSGLSAEDVCCACGGGQGVNGSTEACCVPVCANVSCGEHGVCSAPDTCTCDVDWGGRTCSSCPIGACGENSICFKTTNGTMAPAAINTSTLRHNSARQLSCVCPTGYALNGEDCRPICSQGCVNGNCTAPEVCSCSSAVGYTLPAWSGANCSVCIDGRHGCDEHATCLDSGSVRSRAECVCNRGYFGNGTSCEPVCIAPCVHGTCTAPNTCTCNNSTLVDGPAWTGPECTTCVQGAHACHENATCSDNQGSLQCTCNAGYQGNGFTCSPVCTGVECGSHGRCVEPDVCECALGWTGENCTRDCGCNQHSTCSESGPGLCDMCQDYTQGLHCETCSVGYFGNASRGGLCRPCPCNNHGTCDALGVCTCDRFTSGPECATCAAGFTGNASDGGLCYTSCSRTSNRLLLADEAGYIASSSSPTCPWPPSPGHSCHAGRETCSFVIQAPNASSIILRFLSFEIECSYDVLRVFDGPSASESNLLASFSGIHTPEPVYSSTNTLLVHWLSDPAFTLGGFIAEYSGSSCPQGCSGHGICSSAGVCECDAGWTQPACNQSFCPGGCNATSTTRASLINGSSGVCVETGLSAGSCLCNDGWAGFDCGIYLPSSATISTAYVTASSSSSVMGVRRAGHTVDFDSVSESFFVFGGLMMDEGSHQQRDGTFGHLHSDLEMFTVGSPRTSRRWVTVDAVSGVPKSRYWHSAVLFSTTQQMYIFGGATGEWPQLGNVTNELWVLTLPSVSTQQLTWTEGPSGLVASYGHTSTKVGSRIITIGGLDENGEFVSGNRMSAYDISTASWEYCNASGAVPNALFGHSAAYASDVGAILVFGGYGRPRRAEYSASFNRSVPFRTVAKRNRLWIYSVHRNEWRIGSPVSTGQGLGRFLHSADIVGDLMIVYGGSTFDHSGPSYECQTADIILYDIVQDTWLLPSAAATRGIQVAMPSPRVAHASCAINTSTATASLWIFGGFDGRPLADMAEVVLNDVVTNYAHNRTVPSVVSRLSCGSLGDCASCTSYSPAIGISTLSVMRLCMWVWNTAGQDAFVTGSCVNRTSNMSGLTVADTVSVVHNAEQCTPCADLSTCNDCFEPQHPSAFSENSTTDLQCRWFQPEFYRFRFCAEPSNAVFMDSSTTLTDVGACPVPCAVRTNCSDCNYAFGCTWCDGSNELVGSAALIFAVGIGRRALTLLPLALAGVWRMTFLCYEHRLGSVSDGRMICPAQSLVTTFKTARVAWHGPSVGGVRWAQMALVTAPVSMAMPAAQV